ncbi:hypothetical protein NDU88_007665 [Pleurodeles waltl]|uniref:Uncharacterized protein n=1 Tax=Pleurodeles waltl TaxID=8319 RepID=A0AAV7PQ08_PLEWA|nr:hypothetical protein NDU88_007665 [Pleurodeles waltl]
MDRWYLGVTTYASLQLPHQVFSVVSLCTFDIRNMCPPLAFRSHDAHRTAIKSLVRSRFDYNISIYLSVNPMLSHRLQSIQRQVEFLVSLAHRFSRCLPSQKIRSAQLEEKNKQDTFPTSLRAVYIRRGNGHARWHRSCCMGDFPAKDTQCATGSQVPYHIHHCVCLAVGNICFLQEHWETVKKSRLVGTPLLFRERQLASSAKLCCYKIKRKLIKHQIKADKALPNLETLSD